MGSSQDIMHQYARQEINRFFSTYDGWTITPLKQTNGYDQEFIAERSISGNKEVKRVLVSFTKNVNKDKLEAMRSSVSGPYGGVRKTDVLLIVPQNADTSCLPSDIRVSFMNSFAFEGDELAWTKKPIAQTPGQKQEKACSP
jgi:hypothetical protein